MSTVSVSNGILRMYNVHVYLIASGMTAAEVDEEEVGEQGWGDDVDIILDDGESQTCLDTCALSSTRSFMYIQKMHILRCAPICVIHKNVPCLCILVR